MARPRQRTPELRERLVAAAVEIYHHSGPGALTTRSVAAAAETSPAAIAELLGGKSGMLAVVAADGFVRLADQLSAIQSESEPAQELALLAKAYREFSRTNFHRFDLMFSRPVDSFGPEVSDLEAIPLIYMAFTRPFASLLDLSTRNQRTIDVATGFVALLHGLAIQERSGLSGGSLRSIERRQKVAIGCFLAGVQAV